MSIFTRPESLLISQVLDSVKSATGLGQSNTERAADDVQRGASNMAQGAKDEFNNVCTLSFTRLDLTTRSPQVYVTDPAPDQHHQAVEA